MDTNLRIFKKYEDFNKKNLHVSCPRMVSYGILGKTYVDETHVRFFVMISFDLRVKMSHVYSFIDIVSLYLDGAVCEYLGDCARTFLAVV